MALTNRAMGYTRRRLRYRVNQSDMRFIIPLVFVATLAVSSSAYSEEKAIEKPVAEVIQSHFLKYGSLESDEDVERVGEVFKDTTVYRVWLKNAAHQGRATTIGMWLLVQGEKVSVFNSGKDAATSLIQGYEGKVTNAKELRTLMSIMTPVSEIKDKGNGVYHVYNGDDFFDVPSGYLVTVKDGKVGSLEFEMKLGEKK